jgi:prephenate dehydrogenase
VPPLPHPHRANYNAGMAEFDSVAIIGVGLIGGSIGRALRERKLAREVVGVGRREYGLRTATELGAIDRGTTVLADGVANAQLVIVATPVDTIVDFVSQAAAAGPNRMLITDAGSTKDVIVRSVEAVLVDRRDGPRFIGSHPLAGDHRTGVEHARADLFDGRKVVVTPTEKAHRAAVLEISAFWQSLGAEVVTMTPAEHDHALAATSHLPHLIAAALALATPKELLPLAASGWRDTTRIAGGDPELWRAIFTSNRQEVLDALKQFDRWTNELRELLALGQDDRLLRVLERAKWMKKNRDALGD